MLDYRTLILVNDNDLDRDAKTCFLAGCASTTSRLTYRLTPPGRALLIEADDASYFRSSMRSLRMAGRADPQATDGTLQARSHPWRAHPTPRAPAPHSGSRSARRVGSQR